MSTLQLTISSDDENDNAANVSKRRSKGGKVTKKDEELSDEDNDEMDNDFEFGGLMVCVRFF